MTSRWENGRISWVLPVTGLVAGLALLAYFPLAAMGSASHQDEVVQAVGASMAHVNPEIKERLLTQAKAYNEKLVGNPVDGFTEELLPYGQQLSPDGHDTAFGYVTIPDIDLCMPMYHGADDAALSAGIGHLEGTSLPIGGTSTHAVLTAHSGLEGMRAFDDIRKLEPGDVFGVKVLGDLHCYRVTGSQTVLPSETRGLAIAQGEDLCTLLTCTPYGVNSHRLLVRGERCEIPEGFPDGGLSPSGPGLARTLPLLAGLLITLALLAYVLSKRVRARARGVPVGGAREYEANSIGTDAKDRMRSR